MKAIGGVLIEFTQKESSEELKDVVFVVDGEVNVDEHKENGLVLETLVYARLLNIKETSTGVDVYNQQNKLLFSFNEESNIIKPAEGVTSADNITYEIPDSLRAMAPGIFGGIRSVKLQFGASTVEYKITEGKDQTYTINKDNDMTVVCNGDISKFKELQVNDKVLDSKNYTKKSGSTIVTLNKDYLDSLEVGTYSLKFVYTDGETETNFKIAKEDETTTAEPTTQTGSSVGSTEVVSATPSTGDYIYVCYAVLTLSTISFLISCSIPLRKSKH